MKKILFSLLLLSGLTAFGQSVNNDMPGGFWVIENNIKTPRSSTIFFYNSARTLIYKETVTGKKINVSRSKTVKQLNAALSQSLLAWQREQVLRQDLQL